VYPDVPGFRITRLVDTFRNGSVAVEIRAEEIGDGGDLGTTHIIEAYGFMTVELVGSRLVPRWTTERVVGGQTFGSGWWALGFIVSPFVLAIMGGSALATLLLVEGSAGSFSFTPAPVDVPSVLPMTIDDVEITAEGMAMSGSAVRAVRGFDRPSLRLAGILSTFSRVTVDAGIFVSTGFPEGEYRWTRVEQTQRFVCTPSVRLASLPIRYEWQIEVPGGGPPVRLESSSGEIEFSAETFVPSGIPGAHEMRTLIVSYSVDGDTVTLRNRNEDGEYHIALTCQAMDQANRMMMEQIYVDMRGTHVEMGDRTDGGGTWAGDIQAGINYISQRVQQAERAARVFDIGPLRGQAPYQVIGRGPIPEELGAFLVNASRFKDPSVRKELLTNVQATFGATALLRINAPLALLQTASQRYVPIEMPMQKMIGK
jgi:hypothetical protein